MRQLSADTARCAGSHRAECNSCMRRLSPPHERQIWMGAWVMDDEQCPSHLPPSKAVFSREPAEDPK